MMMLEWQGRHSLRLVTGTFDEVAAHLLKHGWQRCTPNSPHEVARFWFGDRRALIVAYRTGTLLAQGREPWRMADALHEYIAIQHPDRG